MDRDLLFTLAKNGDASAFDKMPDEDKDDLLLMLELDKNEELSSTYKMRHIYPTTGCTTN